MIRSTTSSRASPAKSSCRWPDSRPAKARSRSGRSTSLDIAPVCHVCPGTTAPDRAIEHEINFA
jgi:hypothetical protein